MSSERADTRRAIYCEMDMIQCDPRPGYEEELWQEGGMFLTKCFSAYLEDCPDHGQIPTGASDQNLRDWISTVEEEFEVAAQKHFTIGLQYECSPLDFQRKLEVIWKADKKMHHEFRSWLERQYGVRKKSKKVDGRGVSKIYSGIATIGYSEIPIGE